MSDNQMKILILLLIIAIAGVGIGLYFTVTINNKEYAQLQEEIAKKKEEEVEKDNEHKHYNETVAVENSKIYGTIERILDNNVYIEVEVDGVITKKAIKENKIYSSTNNITQIIMDGKKYIIDSNEQAITIDYANNESFNISFIDTDITKYNNTEIKQGIEEYNGQMLNYETVGSIKYYYNGYNLLYAIKDGKEMKIVSIKDAQDSLFELPQNYVIIDKTIIVQ